MSRPQRATLIVILLVAAALRLTGLDTEENQARRLLNDLDTFRMRTNQQQVDESVVAHQWLRDCFEPVVSAIPKQLRGKRDPAQLYHELLEYRWFQSEREKRDVPTAEAMVLDYIRSHVKQPKSAPLAGNSIATDRGFIARDMPALDDFLHYRMIDVSSIKELCRRWYPRIYFGQPEKGLAHRALADIHESIRELQYYRRTAFVAPPGPSSADIALVAGELGPPGSNDSAKEPSTG